MIKLILITVAALVFSGLSCSEDTNPAFPGNDSVALCQHIELSPDEQSFILKNTRQEFNPWGMNYGHYGILVKDFKDTEWDTLQSDFEKLKDMGANVVRIHLQYDEFMLSVDDPNPQAIAGYKRLLKIAQRSGLYLDITGLACYRPAHRLAWYDSLDETNRWKAQARFWSIIAKAGSGSPAVFCYDLMNEPIIPGKARKAGAWYTGHLGGFDFGQYLTLDPRGRTENSIGYEWISKMAESIRKFDEKALITVGFLPWTKADFIDTVASKLDFISIHIYPKTDHIEAAMKLLKNFDANKPVVIEETFPLACDTAQLADFMLRSRTIATGWIGHYLMSFSLEELQAKKDKSMVESIYQSWLEMFVRMKPQFSPASINCK